MSASHRVGQTFLSALLDLTQSRSLPFFNDIPASGRSGARNDVCFCGHCEPLTARGREFHP